MTTAEPVVISEYGTAEVDLEAEAVVQLRRVVGTRLTVTPTERTDRWELRAGSHVGTVVVPGLRLLIRPKVEAANLFHMLEAGGSALGIGAGIFDYQQTHDLLPAFATFYARLLERTFARGIARQYLQQEDRLVTIRGRVDTKAQLRLAGLSLPVACTFDDYTSDIALNRLVRAAADRLLRLPGVTTPTRYALSALAARLEEVTALRTQDVETPTVFNRLNRHYEPVERLARLVLAGSTINEHAGATAAGTFLIDMNRLFEEFVESRLSRSLLGRLDVRGQYPTALDRQGLVPMRPDLVFLDSGRVVYVADSKYKVTATGFGREADYYQLLAYVTGLGLREGVLVYCHHDGAAPKRVAVRNTDVALHTWPIRLTGTPQQLDDEVATLAGWIFERMAPHRLLATA